MRTLTLERLTADAFAPFGDVVEADALRVRHFPINQGTTERFHDLMAIDVDQLGRPIVSIFRAQPRSLPLTIAMMERHPLGSQAFIPLSGRPYLVVVAPPGDGLSESAIRAFYGLGHQGVNYARGVWHHPLLALTATSDFLVIDRAGEGDNCDELRLDNPLCILAPVC